MPSESITDGQYKMGFEEIYALLIMDSTDSQVHLRTIICNPD